MAAGLTRPERSLFDEAMAYYEARTPAGAVLRFRGKPVAEIVWSERDKIRVVLEYQKDTQGVAQRNGFATVFAPTMKSGAGPTKLALVDPQGHPIIDIGGVELGDEP